MRKLFLEQAFFFLHFDFHQVFNFVGIHGHHEMTLKNNVTEQKNAFGTK